MERERRGHTHTGQGYEERERREVTHTGQGYSADRLGGRC